ncbi:MAG: hypothetical protein WDN31_06210 [Hyphomicrobium sp.]
MLSARLTLDLHDPRGPSFDGRARPSRRRDATARDAFEYARLFARALYSLPADVIAASVVINLLGLALPLAILQVYDRVIHNGASTTLLFSHLMPALVFEATLRITRSQVIAWSAMKEAWKANVGAATRVALAPARLVDREPAALLDTAVPGRQHRVRVQAQSVDARPCRPALRAGFPGIALRHKPVARHHPARPVPAVHGQGLQLRPTAQGHNGGPRPRGSEGPRLPRRGAERHRDRQGVRHGAAGAAPLRAPRRAGRRLQLPIWCE